MVGLSALWMPIVVSAVFVLIALLILHMMPGWHKRDMLADPAEDKVMETLRCYSVAHWQNWIWWGKGTRYTLTNTIDGLIYAPVTARTSGWLWPR
jgi:hypothetical protein